MSNIEFLCSIFKEASSIKYTIHTSPIHGSGVFAVKDIVIGEVIDIILECIDNDISNKYRRNSLGLYVNHAEPGNSKFIKKDDNYYLIANKFINENDEITTSYQDYQKLLEAEHKEENKGVIVL
jgi:hypothetical protein